MMFKGLGAQITQDSMFALSQEDSLKDALKHLISWRLPSGKPFIKAIDGRIDTSKGLADLELALDRAYYKWARRQIGCFGRAAKFTKKMFKQGIDTLNINTLIRLVGTSDEIDKPLSYMLPGGAYVAKSMFERLSKIGDVTNLLDDLHKQIPQYRAALQQGYDDFVATGRLSEIQHALDTRLTRQTIEEGNKDLTGFGLMLAYLTSKENAASNLGIIARGIFRGVARDSIEKDLILV